MQSPVHVGTEQGPTLRVPEERPSATVERQERRFHLEQERPGTLRVFNVNRERHTFVAKCGPIGVAFGRDGVDDGNGRDAPGVDEAGLGPSEALLGHVPVQLSRELRVGHEGRVAAGGDRPLGLTESCAIENRVKCLPHDPEARVAVVSERAETRPFREIEKMSVLRIPNGLFALLKESVEAIAPLVVRGERLDKAHELA